MIVREEGGMNLQQQQGQSFLFVDDKETKRQRSSDASTWNTEDVSQWLSETGYDKYVESFTLNHVDGRILLTMDLTALAELVPSLGHRVALLEAIEKLRATRAPRHVGEGVIGGLQGFTTKLVNGLDHLVNDPISGAQRDGVSGLFKGLQTGIVEAIHLPAEGVAILSHQLGEGLKHTPDTLFGAEPKPPVASSSSPSLPSTLSTIQKIENAKPEFLRFESGTRPSHVGEGLVNGAKSLGSGIYDGLTGIVLEPWKAAVSASSLSSKDKRSAEKEDDSHSSDTGANALPSSDASPLSASSSSPSISVAIAKGVAKGITGAVCKPVAGGFDFATQMLHGLINTPQAVAAAAKDGPSIQETPTVKRLNHLRQQTVEGIRRMTAYSSSNSSAGSSGVSSSPSLVLPHTGTKQP